MAGSTPGTLTRTSVGGGGYTLPTYVTAPPGDTSGCSWSSRAAGQPDQGRRGSGHAVPRHLGLVLTAASAACSRWRSRPTTRTGRFYVYFTDTAATSASSSTGARATRTGPTRSRRPCSPSSTPPRQPQRRPAPVRARRLPVRGHGRRRRRQRHPRQRSEPRHPARKAAPDRPRHGPERRDAARRPRHTSPRIRTKSSAGSGCSGSARWSPTGAAARPVPSPPAPSSGSRTLVPAEVGAPPGRRAQAGAGEGRAHRAGAARAAPGAPERPPPRRASGPARPRRGRQQLEAGAPDRARQALASSARRRSRKRARPGSRPARAPARRRPRPRRAGRRRRSRSARAAWSRWYPARSPRRSISSTSASPRSGPPSHRHGHGAVQLHHRARLDPEQQLVERRPPAPSRCLAAPSARRRSGPAASRARLGRPARVHQRGALGDLAGVPARAVLVLQQHELAGRVEARVAARVMEQHQREQAEHLGLVGHQGGEDAARGGSPRRRARARTSASPLVAR